MTYYRMRKTGEVKPTQQKVITAGTTTATVVPDDGYILTRVDVTPQVHSQTKVITEHNSAYDLGMRHNYRYIDTSGTGLKETLLWTNSAPTSNFSAQEISLNNFSGGINGYEYYKVVYKASTASTDDELTAIISAASLANNSSDLFRGAIAVKSSNWYVRCIYWVSASAKFQITTAYQLSSTSTSASKCIPLRIYGLKY